MSLASIMFLYHKNQGLYILTSLYLNPYFTFLKSYSSNTWSFNYYLQEEERMSSRCRAWMVAGTVGLVEALKDQGFARWNYTIRSIHHHAKSNLRSISRTMSSPTAEVSKFCMEKKAKQSEESLRKVMYLSSWGPN